MLPAGSCTRTPALPATTDSCSMAAGRRTSVETTSGYRPCFASIRASLPVVVVLPEPCRPSMRMTFGSGPPVVSPPLASPNSAEQLIADDLDDLLVGAQALLHLLRRGAVAHAIDERLDHLAG